ncbi:hypothetical protein ACONDI_01111 [Natranaerofaba carboxydovora]|nr:hypothetical protein ACONDI_01111 [Natranaerofaba carboxydovora]
MKKILIILITISLILIVGCDDVDTEVFLDINEDGSGIFKKVSMFRSSYVDGTQLEEIRSYYEEKGLETKKLYEDNWVGVKATKEVDDLNDMEIGKVLDGFDGEVQLQEVDSSLMHETYQLELELYEESLEGTIYEKVFGDHFMWDPSNDVEADFYLSIPGESEHHNADMINDEDYKMWNMDSSLNNEVDVKYQVETFRTNTLLSFLLVISIGIGAFVYGLHRKKVH